MILCAMLLCSIAHSIICMVRLFRGKMHSDRFNGIEILQGRWQHREKVGYCSPRGLEKTLCKWDIYVPLVTKGLYENTHRWNLRQLFPTKHEKFIRQYIYENKVSFVYVGHDIKRRRRNRRNSSAFIAPRRQLILCPLQYDKWPQFEVSS